MTNPPTSSLRACLLGVLALLSLLGSPSSASAELIGMASNIPGAIYSIDPVIGAATLLTNTPLTDTAFIGAEFRQGVFYVSDVCCPTIGLALGTYDLKTGAFTQVSDQGGSQNLQGLAYRPGNDLFYSVDTFATGQPLVTINPNTGAVATIGNTNALVRGMAFDQASDILYGVTGDVGVSINLVTINPSTGVVTTIGATGQTGQLVGLAFDEDRKILYMNLGSQASTPNTLFTINTATGAATNPQGNGAVVGFGIDALAWRPNIAAVPVPEPSTLALTGLGMLGVLGWVRRRKKRWHRRRGAVCRIASGTPLRRICCGRGRISG